MTTVTLASMVDYAAVGILVLIAIGFGLFNLIASMLLGPGRTGPTKSATYESGMVPFGTARKRFNVRFYILAMTFLVFDVEIVFLYPWATVFPNLATHTADGKMLAWQFLARMIFFIATSVVAYLYAWRKGVFRFD